MKLLLTGHEERYAIEQLQLSLFPGEHMEPVHGPFQGDGAESVLSRGAAYLTATTTIWYHGQKSQCTRRMRLESETVQLRRRLLQRSYYGAACPLLPEPPPGGFGWSASHENNDQVSSGGGSSGLPGPC